MPWHARLSLDYTLEAGRTAARFQHDGPLRILQSLYPEGDAICHNVLVHPPSGLVGGDTLDVQVAVQAGAHGLVTTPGATRFYRSDGELALQRSRLRVHDGARLEWLPLETLCYSGCIAQNHLTLDLAPGAECMGWDVTALGLPHADLPFERGSFVQHLELPGVWLERGRIDAADARLMNGPLGLAGQRCMATLFFVSGGDIPRARRDAALDAARALIEAHALRPTAGATAPHPRVLVVRVLAPVVEPAMQLLKALRGQWRDTLWGLSPHPPRIWSA
ncbi:MAG: urease accessory protein UreD [Ramlibacter sp.]